MAEVIIKLIGTSFPQESSCPDLNPNFKKELGLAYKSKKWPKGGWMMIEYSQTILMFTLHLHAAISNFKVGVEMQVTINTSRKQL